MMSDLISRSALIEKLKEKSIVDEVNILSTTYTYKELVYIISNQPTAFDVEKVVAMMDEALIEFEDGTDCKTCVFKDACDTGYEDCVQTMVYVCKDIVRKGGVE